MVIGVLHNLKMMCDLLPQKNKCVLKHQKNYFFLIQEVMQRSHIQRNEGMRLYTDSSKSLNSIIKNKYIHSVFCGLE